PSLTACCSRSSGGAAHPPSTSARIPDRREVGPESGTSALLVLLPHPGVEVGVKLAAVVPDQRAAQLAAKDRRVDADDHDCLEHGPTPSLPPQWGRSRERRGYRGG